MPSSVPTPQMYFVDLGYECGSPSLKFAVICYRIIILWFQNSIETKFVYATLNPFASLLLHFQKLPKLFGAKKKSEFFFIQISRLIYGN